MNTIWENPQFIGFHWTNNNSESLNHILKMSINWTPQALINLIETLRNVVGGLYQDVTRAIVGRGQFRLAEDFSQFFIERSFWRQKTDKAKKNHLNRFGKCLKLSDSRQSEISKNGVLRMYSAPGGGKKPNQLKRKIAARTRSIKRSRGQ